MVTTPKIVHRAHEFKVLVYTEVVGLPHDSTPAGVTAVQQLADAFSEGRLSSADLEQRSGKALGARTYGELDDVLQ